jgi:antirestriction protein ArdC
MELAGLEPATLLLAAQCHERGIDARRVAGFRTWLKLGRCVRKGEKGLVVLAPMPIKRRQDSEEQDEARVVFRSAFVFADSQLTDARLELLRQPEPAEHGAVEGHDVGDGPVGHA